MMILGIETATVLCGVGLVGDEGLVAEYRLRRGYTHAERLPGAVEKVLTDAEISPGQLDGIGVSIGPGSFTGLRIGLGLAKGLALGWEKSLVAVETMDGLVSQVPGVCDWACVMLVARKGEVYQRLYGWEDDRWMAVGAYQLVQEAGVGKGLPKGDVLFLGEGAACYREMLRQRKKGAKFLGPALSLPSGYGVAARGRELLMGGEVADADALVPLYLKRFQGMM